MALINCPECGKEISGIAEKCPSCGYPIKATTIEATGKRWKALKVLSIFMVIMGLIMGGSDFASRLLVFGILLFLGSVLGAWWHHG